MHIFLAACALGLAGCGGGGNADGGGDNAPPTITGTPATLVQVGSSYSFLPTASDPEGETLGFSIVNKPAWATFNAATGALTGTPDADDVGTTSGIIIRVSDGTSTRSLPSFTLTVSAAQASGTLTVTWIAPSSNTDGSGLANLAGYLVRYGTSAGNLASSVTVPPTTLSHTFTGLASGQYFVSVAAYASDGSESAPSAPASGIVP